MFNPELKIVEFDAIDVITTSDDTPAETIPTFMGQACMTV